MGDAESLLHAERVVAQAALRLGLGEADCGEHLVDATAGRPIVIAPIVRISRPVRPACWAEASSRIPTWRPGLGRSWYDPTVEVTRPLVAGVRPDHDPHRGALAGTVRSEEAGDLARGRLEGDVVDGDVVAVRLGDVFDGNHGSSVELRPARRHIGRALGRRRTLVELDPTKVVDDRSGRPRSDAPRPRPPTLSRVAADADYQPALTPVAPCLADRRRCWRSARRPSGDPFRERVERHRCALVARPVAGAVAFGLMFLRRRYPLRDRARHRAAHRRCRQPRPARRRWR